MDHSDNPPHVAAVATAPKWEAGTRQGQMTEILKGVYYPDYPNAPFFQRSPVGSATKAVWLGREQVDDVGPGLFFE